MPKYIDADSLVRDFTGGMPPADWHYWRYSGKQVVDLIERQPAADVRPERHAKWLDMDDYLMCSGCGAPHNEPDKNYCPNCGAKMVGYMTDEEKVLLFKDLLHRAESLKEEAWINQRAEEMEGDGDA